MDEPKKTVNKTYSIDAINAEALRIWAFETDEKYSRILNRLISENCPKEIMQKARDKIEERRTNN